VSHVSPLRFLSFFDFKKVSYVKKEHKGKNKNKLNISYIFNVSTGTVDDSFIPDLVLQEYKI